MFYVIPADAEDPSWGEAAFGVVKFKVHDSSEKCEKVLGIL